MNCKHRWIPIYGDQRTHAHYQCTRCSKIITALLKEKT